MAEALLAFGVAANVVAFIDFTAKIISAGSDKYGGLSDLNIVETVNEDLRATLEELETSVKRERGREGEVRLTENQIGLLNLARECDVIAKELFTALESLKMQAEVHEKSQKETSTWASWKKAQPVQVKWRHFRIALRAAWKEDQIKGLEQRLEKFRHQLVFRILVAFRDETKSSHEAQSSIKEHVTRIDQSTQGLGEQFLSYVEESRRWQEDLIQAIHHDESSAIDRGLSMNVSITRRTQLLQTKLLGQLHFLEMDDRESRIVIAHEKTFSWIYRDPEIGNHPWPSFIKWLNSGSGLYWITGKPGSGKSTLMKYIFNNQQTLDGLRSWSCGNPLVTAGFFFWSSGTKIQMSLVGLLQSILYQLLLKHPDLIPKMLPRRWEAYNLFGHDSQAWTQQELTSAFKLLANEETMGTKFCFFIDGLDEFDGDHSELNRLLKDAASSPHVKICVASRPWNVFEDAFGERSFLMLQDLTHGDIQAYVKSNFDRNPGFAELEAREPRYAQELQNHISEKSSGVFLWVFLVVKSLLLGLVNGDRVLDLEKRLALIPPDLEDLYQKMLSSLDPFYYAHASQLFQVINAAFVPPTLLSLSFADEELNFVFDCPVKPLTRTERISRADIMRRRLNSCCKGLLEVAHTPTEYEEFPADLDTNRPDRTAIEIELAGMDEPALASLTVQYLHRTVKDYLGRPNVWDKMIKDGPENFDPNLALCAGFISQFKHTNPNILTSDFFWTSIKRLVQYVKVNERTEKIFIALLDELDRSAAELALSLRHDGSTFLSSYSNFARRKPLVHRCLWPHWTSTFSGYANDRGMTFLSLAVKFNLKFYVQAKATTNCLVTQDSGLWSLLSDAVIPGPKFGGSFNPSIFPDIDMVTMLLQHGADPNFRREVTMLLQESPTTGNPTYQRSRLAHSIFECLLESAVGVRDYSRLNNERIIITPNLGVRTIIYSSTNVYVYSPEGRAWLEAVYQFLAYGSEMTPEQDVKLGISFFGALKTNIQVYSNTGFVKSWLGVGNSVSVSQGPFQKDDPRFIRARASILGTQAPVLNTQKLIDLEQQ